MDGPEAAPWPGIPSPALARPQGRAGQGHLDAAAHPGSPAPRRAYQVPEKRRPDACACNGSVSGEAGAWQEGTGSSHYERTAPWQQPACRWVGDAPPTRLTPPSPPFATDHSADEDIPLRRLRAALCSHRAVRVRERLGAGAGAAVQGQGVPANGDTGLPPGRGSLECQCSASLDPC